MTTQIKAKDQTLFFDTILSLSFSGNEAIWDRKTNERKILEKTKRGELDLSEEGAKSPSLLKFFIGALLAAFAAFPGIANTLLRCESGNGQELTILLEGGRRLKLPLGKWSPELQELIVYYKQKILGWDKAPADFAKNDWQSLRDVFKYSQLRLGGEHTFLKSLISSSKKILSLLKEPGIRMDSLFIILSALPREQLNMFFIEIAQYIPEYLTGHTPEGTYIDIRHYFNQSSVDLENLFGKIKILLMLYSRHELIIDYVLEEKTKEILLKLLQNDTIRAATLEEIEKTIHGQYQPRMDFAKALAKILS
jgi:hypothetical protein